jgi:hypothetical protein
MKDPIVGYDAEGKPFAVFCGECLGSCALVTPSRSLEEAIQQEREHCHPRCPLCGAERARNTFCAPCASAREQKDLETFFRRAKHVPLSEYDGRYCVAPGDDDFDAPDAWDDDPERPCGEVDGVRFVWGTEGEGHEVDLERECSENWLADAADIKLDGAPTVRLVIGPHEAKDLFRLREIEDGAQRRAALLHLVRAHERRRHATPHEASQVREHLRGRPSCTWGGCSVSIAAPTQSSDIWEVP